MIAVKNSNDPVRQEALLTTWLETEFGDRIALHGLCAIGRDESNNIILSTSQISRRHALIVKQDDGYWVVDLGGVNGVYVNGNRVNQRQRLQAGDRLEMASNVFTFRQGEDISAGTVPPAATADVLAKGAVPLPETKETVPIPVLSKRTESRDELTPQQKPSSEEASSGAGSIFDSYWQKALSPLQNLKSSRKRWVLRLGIAGVITGLSCYFLVAPLIKRMVSARGTHTISAAKPASPPTTQVARLGDVKLWTNSLGMKFVPAGTPNVLFCIWDVRVKDFQAYASATQEEPSDGIYVTKVNIDENGGCSIVFDRDPAASWKNPGFSHAQTVNDPVVGISWNEAKAFCQWLTEKERATKKIGPNLEYRLPTDAEWTKAAGKGKYPWGDGWPQPEHVGNYCDQAFAVGLPGAGWSTFVLPENDGYAQTSPVGSFRANAYGLYDMGGNVWQWCEDWYQSSMNSEAILHTLPAMGDDDGGDAYKVLRGASWAEKTPEHLLSACRSYDDPATGFADRGFRVVLSPVP